MDNHLPKQELLAWLLEGPPWVRYHTQIDLQEQAPTEPQVDQVRQAMLADPLVKELVEELAAWPGAALTSHKSAGHLLHRLTFAADLGMKYTDPGMEHVVGRILDHQSIAGPFQVLMNIPVHFGGTGDDSFAWALCDAPLVLYALARFGLNHAPAVEAAAMKLSSLVRQNGWPCAVSPELGKFRGPGRKDDPCPFANLVMLKTLAQFPEWKDSLACRLGIEAQLYLWENRRNIHPYQFYMGTDFSKLKAPLVWYDLLHVLDVLSHYPWVASDTRLQEMLELLDSKADDDGRFTPESVWTAWNEWEFGQKKAPSRWLTLLVYRIFTRFQIDR